VVTPSPSTLNEASKRLRKFAAKISDVRMFLRLFGLVGMYSWGKTTLRKPSNDPVEQGLVLSQVGVNVGFQVLENLAYLNSNNILGFSKRTEKQMWLWSTRCWLAHIVLEFLRLERVRRRKWTIKKGSILDREEQKKIQDNWMKAWITNAANAPLSVCFPA
jgi:hypothetical protein